MGTSPQVQPALLGNGNIGEWVTYDTSDCGNLTLKYACDKIDQIS